MYKHSKVNIYEILLKYSFFKNVSNIFFFKARSVLEYFLNIFSLVVHINTVITTKQTLITL